MKRPPRWSLAKDKVRFVGEVVAVVVAETAVQAKDAAEAVMLDIEELPAVTSPEAALADGAQSIHAELGNNLAYEHHIAAGGVDEAFAIAHRVIRRKLRFARHTGVPLEGRTVIAEFEPGTRQLTVHQSTQVPH